MFKQMGPPLIADPSTHELVVEVFSPDATFGNTFFIGSNPNGESAPSYVSSAPCNAPEPTPTAAIGFPSMHTLMVVDGTEASTEPTPVPTLSAYGLALLAGLLGLLGLMRRRAA